MSLSYNKFWNLLSENKFDIIQLQKELSLNEMVLKRIEENKAISLKNIEKICKFFHCGIDDILEFDKDLKKLDL